MSSYASEAELGEFGEFEGEGEFGGFQGEYGAHGGAVSPLSEAQEIGLASELLEISSEAELEQFLDGLISKVGGFFKSPVGQALGGIVKNVAKKALPMVGGALGTMVAPGIGTALGGQLGSLASNLFELEAMPAEQAEFETARRLVGLTAAAANNAAQMQQRWGISPNTIARAAVAEAARQYAPGLRRQMIQRAQYTGQGMAANQAARAAQAAPGQAAPGQVPIGRQPGAQNGRPAVQNGRPPRRRPGYGYAYGYGGDFGDVPFDAPQGDYADADGEPSSFPDSAEGWRPMSGRWVRRGRRIVLLGI